LPEPTHPAAMFKFSLLAKHSVLRYGSKVFTQQAQQNKPCQLTSPHLTTSLTQCVPRSSDSKQHKERRADSPPCRSRRRCLLCCRGQIPSIRYKTSSRHSAGSYQAVPTHLPVALLAIVCSRLMAEIGCMFHSASSKTNAISSADRSPHPVALFPIVSSAAIVKSPQQFI
jgi:hypothetical protein